VLAALKVNGLTTAANKIVIKGYSELAPVACNDTLDNMQINRRVEVWAY
jgi:outer membrane protein OmpA-like peptidoglycan-associated protein